LRIPHNVDQPNRQLFSPCVLSTVNMCGNFAQLSHLGRLRRPPVLCAIAHASIRVCEGTKTRVGVCCGWAFRCKAYVTLGGMRVREGGWVGWTPRQVHASACMWVLGHGSSRIHACAYAALCLHAFYLSVVLFIWLLCHPLYVDALA
jgi:hypothetical protein